MLVSLAPWGGIVTWVGASSGVTHSLTSIRRSTGACFVLALGTGAQALELVHCLRDEGVGKGELWSHARVHFPFDAFLNYTEAG